MGDSLFRDSGEQVAGGARPAGGAYLARVRRASSSAMDAVRACGVVPTTGVHARERLEVTPVGEMSFILRAHVAGVARFASEAELAGARELKVGVDGPLRGAFGVAGPPRHTLVDLFFPDLAITAGELWRAVKHVPEPGTAMDFAVESEALTISVEHEERALIVSARSTAGQLHARRAYDPFAFIDGVVAACERLDRFLRAHGLAEASQAMYRHFARPAFPRCTGG